VFNSPEAQKWESKTLEDVCRDISDGTHFTPEYIDSGIPFLSVKNIREYGIFFEDCRFISVKQHQDFCKRCKPEKGDVLYTKVGTTGIAKAIDIEQEFSIFVSVALLKLGSLVVPEYLETVLNSPICRKQAETLTQGAANRNLVLKDLKRINFPLPSILKQQQIAAEVSSKMENVKTLENSLKSQLEAINQIPSAILRKAFNGQL
jgi:type I restriction enzyme S subunit